MSIYMRTGLRAALLGAVSALTVLSLAPERVSAATGPTFVMCGTSETTPVDPCLATLESAMAPAAGATMPPAVPGQGGTHENGGRAGSHGGRPGAGSDPSDSSGSDGTGGDASDGDGGSGEAGDGNDAVGNDAGGDPGGDDNGNGGSDNPGGDNNGGGDDPGGDTGSAGSSGDNGNAGGNGGGGD